MMFAAIAPSITQANAGGDDPPTGTISKEHIELLEPECFEGITIVKPSPTICAFSISYVGDLAIIEDTVPAEWEVLGFVQFSGVTCTADTKNSGKSATKITCDETDLLLVGVIVQTRESPSNGKGNSPNKVDKFKPTSCGPLVLNDGAVAFVSADGVKTLELDADGNLVPIVIDTSVPIVLNAVNPDDLDCDGIDNEDEIPGCEEDPNPICTGPV